MNKKKKYIVVFLTKEQEVYTFVRKKRVSSTKEQVSSKNKTYLLNISKPLYSKGLTLYYFIDIITGQIFIDKNDKKNINAEVIDMILSKKIITQLTSNLTLDNLKMNIMNIIIGVGIGTPIGYIIGFMLGGK